MYEQYTDKQIVEMLKPKLAKLGWEPEFGPRTEKLISTLYKSGYIRGQLGRSFIIGEKKAKESVDTFKEKVTEHWVPATKDNVKVGSKVRMIDEGSHKSKPWRFPDVGTVGTVTEVNIHAPLVQWPKGSTSRTDEWCCNNTRLEVLLCE